MTMLTSLKALLFPSATGGVAPAVAASAPAMTDFATLLGDMTAPAPPPVPDAPLPVTPVPDAAIASGTVPPATPSADEAVSEGASPAAQSGSLPQAAKTADTSFRPRANPMAAPDDASGAVVILSSPAPVAALPPQPAGAASVDPHADATTPLTQRPGADESASVATLPSEEANAGITPQVHVSPVPENGVVPEAPATVTTEPMVKPAPAPRSFAIHRDQPDRAMAAAGKPQAAVLDSDDDGAVAPDEAREPSAASPAGVDDQPRAWPAVAAAAPPPTAPPPIITPNPPVAETSEPPRAASAGSASTVHAALDPRAVESHVADDTMAMTESARQPHDDDAQLADSDMDGPTMLAPDVPGQPPAMAAAHSMDSSTLTANLSPTPASAPATVAEVAPAPAMSRPTPTPHMRAEPARPAQASAALSTDGKDNAPPEPLDIATSNPVASSAGDPASAPTFPPSAAPQAAAPALGTATPAMPQGGSANPRPDAPAAVGDRHDSRPQPLAAIPTAPGASPPDAAAPMPVAALTTAPPPVGVAEAARPADDTPRDTGGDSAEIAAPAAHPARKVVAEAVSLLQLVRDQMRGPAPRLATAERQAAPIQPDQPVTSPVDATPPVPAVSLAGSPAALTPPPAVGAPVDLSATLGARIVDIGVAGQWIDGLARDIAGLSANGAQGRFQIDAGQLGPVQIDIRQGADGAAVSLTVASDLAEQALRQDSDRLKLDASLSAVRISEVRVERAALPEPARADSGNGSANPQQQSGQGQQQGWQSAQQGWGQSAAQGQTPHRQPRENFSSSHKGNGEPAVLNHEQARGESADLPRARYA